MNKKDFTANRQSLAALLEDRSLAVINSNDTMPTNADGTMKFRQNNDLYWLTGIIQEDTLLLLCPSHPDESLREVLFIKHADETFFKWHGRRLSLAEAAELSGIGHVLWEEEFEAVFYEMTVQSRSIYLNAIEHPRAGNKVQTRDDRFAAWCTGRFRLHQYRRLAPLMARLRVVKSPAELALLQEACRISGLGFKRMLKSVKPGVREKQLAAELIHEYMQHGGDWAGYEPIVASGQNSCILHYIGNSNSCHAGDMLLVDAAASYRLYNADLTRTVPVSGRFSKRQRQVYDSVLGIHKALKKHIKAGLYLHDVERYKNELVLRELVTLKLCTTAEIREKGGAYFIDRYSYHGFGHYLGLDVHDVGDKFEQIPLNAVITVEPGIYIWEESTGVRLENNVVVKRTGTQDLMADIPLEAEEIEDLVNSH